MTKLRSRFYWMVVAMAVLVTAILHDCLEWLSRTTSLHSFRTHAKSNGHLKIEGLHGYESIEQLKDRSNRFPSIDERVQIYMSNWYIPSNCSIDTNSSVSFRYIDQKNIQPFREVIVEEIHMDDSFSAPRRFLIDSQNTLGKLHFLEEGNMIPESCDSEYCIDMIRYFLPSLRRSNAPRDVPVIFQFSDEETSRAFSPTSHHNELYPNVPHFKKSRFSIPHDSQMWVADSCSGLVPFHLNNKGSAVPIHFHPSTFRLIFPTPLSHLRTLFSHIQA